MWWTPYLEAGVLPGVYLTSHIQRTDGDAAQPEYFDEAKRSVRRVQLSGLLSLGVEHDLSERYGLFVQAYGRYQLSPLAEGTIKERGYAAGLEVGVRRSFR